MSASLALTASKSIRASYTAPTLNRPSATAARMSHRRAALHSANTASMATAIFRLAVRQFRLQWPDCRATEVQ